MRARRMQVARYPTDDEREEGIHMEIMVDVGGPEEQAKGEMILAEARSPRNDATVAGV